jgi:5-(carboxyamino)imidazole ribonucleotide mutase
MMPTGIPVATVAINGGGNAALLAAQIIALTDENLAARLDKKRQDDAEAVLKKDAAVCAEFQ